MNHLPTIDLAGAVYYLQLQSNDHCNLLSTRQEFESLRQLFAPLCQQHGGKVLGYCLFQDSLHLVLRAGEQGIAAMSAWLVDTYTQHYNQQHSRNGSVFNPHILTVLIEPQHYLLPVIHKLHRLPVTAGLVASPSAYPWCSHREYLAADCPAWLDRQEVLVKVANHRTSQLRRYEHFIEDSVQATVDWVNGLNSHYRALASDSFIQRMLSQHHTHEALPILDLDALTEWICGEYQIEEKDLLLWRHHRISGEVQAVIGALALSFHVAEINDIANYFRSDIDVLTSGIRGIKSRRSMYLFKLELQLNQWLTNQSQDQTPQQTALPVETEKNNVEPADFNQENLAQDNVDQVNAARNNFDQNQFVQEELEQADISQNQVDYTEFEEDQIPLLNTLSTDMIESSHEYSEINHRQ